MGLWLTLLEKTLLEDLPTLIPQKLILKKNKLEKIKLLTQECEYE